jgi:hypothetical protein
MDYTMLAVGTSTPDTLEPLLALDDNTDPTSGNAKVRVIHASPDAPNVDVFVDGTEVLTNVPYKAISGYLEVPAGVRVIEVFVTGTAATDPAVITASPDLADGTIYTIIAMNQVSAIEAVVLIDN